MADQRSEQSQIPLTLQENVEAHRSPLGEPISEPHHDRQCFANEATKSSEFCRSPHREEAKNSTHYSARMQFVELKIVIRENNIGLSFDER